MHGTQQTVGEAKAATAEGRDAIALFATSAQAREALHGTLAAGGFEGWTVIPSARLARNNASGARIRFVSVEEGLKGLRGYTGTVVVDHAAKPKLSDEMRDAIAVCEI